jgi:hypothetical protein
MARPNAPRQNNGAALPADFARTLRELYASGDPRLGPTMKAANEHGWTFALLGSALELTGNRARQISMKNAGNEPVADIPEPVPGAPTTADEPSRLTPEETELLRALCDDAFSLKAGIKPADRLQAEEKLDDALAEQWLRGVPFQHLADELNFPDPAHVQGRVFQAWTRATRK